MAYMSQERKKTIEPVIKAILKKYGVKGSVGVDHHSTLVLNIKSGPIDFFADRVADPYGRNNDAEDYEKKRGHIQINHYHYDRHFSGKSREFLTKVITAMNAGNHDNSDIQSDYHDVGWYVSVNVGKWNLPYSVIEG
jgi:hypothetical protein